MNKDLIYIFDKLTFQRQELGEIQSGFNMSLTIDGTKDSTKLMVWSFNDTEIEPNTICWHAKTNTWWIVAHDKVERYLNENETFIYVHNLQLEGAIELLNARDLTDCGFNQNTYTKGEFLERLIDLSSFEFKGNNIQISAIANFLDQKVDYVKTFENYSLLSAIREFLDSYNMCAKLEFTQSHIGNVYTLQLANLVIINKTGDNTLTTHNMSEFDDVRETKNMDKNSFGTTVVSNAENVISSVSKTYPSTGTVKISGQEYIINSNNAVIRLPSKVYKANWLKIILPFAPIVMEGSTGLTESFYTSAQALNVRTTDEKSLNDSIANILEKVYTVCQNAGTDVTFFNPFQIAFREQQERFKEEMKLVSSITLYNGNQLDPINGKIIKGDNVPYIPKLWFFSKNNVDSDDPNINPYRHTELIFCDKETKETLPHKWQGIQWERGSDVISGFDGFHTDINGGQDAIVLENAYNTDLQNRYGYARPEFFTFSNEYGSITIRFGQTNDTDRTFIRLTTRKELGIITVYPSSFIVNYIPMSDIKVKVDNSRNKRDMHLYNQNGKLTDNFALSKMLNSYSKEISSDTITKYKWYYSFNTVPKVGSMANTTSGETYVVNNVSLDFSQNEKDNNDFGYIIECEITMSKYVSTKSLMVNPNTNIRDYGIPQNFNVKRKQLYRDYYEIGYTLSVDTDDDYYIDPQRMFNIGRESNEYINLIAVIRCDYKEPIGGNEDEEIDESTTWYYQLETTTYSMNKMIYVVCDFKDNNIIGYSNQNVWSGFKIERILSGNYDTINIPISYVDAKGEIEHIYIKLCDNEQLTTIYDYYKSTHGGDAWKGSLYNYSCFIPSEIYEGLTPSDYTMLISEPYYRKDAIEVPVFEYACQVDDSNEVLIGDNILTQHDNCIYFYHYIVGNNLTQDNVIDGTSIEHESIQYPNRYKMDDSATINYVSVDYLKMLEINLYNYTQYDSDTNTWTDYVKNNINANKDLAIFRHSYNLATGEELVELMFIAKNISQSAIDQNDKTLMLVLNHYKLN